MSANQISEYLVIALGDRRFALTAAAVETAVAPLPVTPLPFVPPHVEGLVNVNERVLPLIDLRRMLAEPGTAPQSELVVVESASAAYALRVDAVLAKVDIDSGVVAVLDRSSDQSTEGDATVAVARFEWEGTSVLVLDANALGRVVVARDVPEGRRGLLGKLHADDQHTAAGMASCVVVRVGGETYGIALDDAIEILDISQPVAIPGAPAEAAGIALVRDEALLVLSLAQLLRRAGSASGKASCSVVVIDRAGFHYGLMVDSVEGIQTYPLDRFRAVEDETGEVSGIVIDNDRVFGLLRATRLLSDERHASLSTFVPARAGSGAASVEVRVAILEVSLGDEFYGIPLNIVRRITDYTGAERVHAGDGAMISGAVNIDGSVVPVVDFSALLQLTSEGANEGAWVIVGDTGGEWAIPVRKARDIIEIPESAIEAINDQRRLVTAVARVENRLISLLSMTPLQSAA